MEKIRNFFMLMVAIMVLSACETELTHYNNIPAGPSFPERLTCGNGTMEEGESCDGKDFNGRTCASYGYERGELTCTNFCRISTENCSFDTKMGISFSERISEELEYQLNHEVHEMQVTIIVMDLWGKPLMGETFNGISHTIEGVPEGIYNIVSFTPTFYFLSKEGWASCKAKTQLQTIVTKAKKDVPLEIEIRCDPVG